MSAAQGKAGTALHIAAISKRYGNHVAVRDVSFTVPAGSIYGILGPNGAGKSTTLRMVNDIIAPDSGEITILGKLRPGRAASKLIGYLPEERGLYPKMKVAEMIAFMAELRGLGAGEAKRRALAWLDRLGLAQWARNMVQDLSKGMQQKVQFACAVIHEPQLLILDEPWSGLDPINADVLQQVVTEQKQKGHTVIFSTHQMEQAEKICDDVCIIARGEVVLAGGLAEIKRAASADTQVALAFATPGDQATAQAVLQNTTLVGRTRPPRQGDAADLYAELAAGASISGLLQALVASGANLRRFEALTPSLHEIFVDRVGEAQAAVAARNPSAGATHA
ncbi:MAG: ATP-binding cassette domain-containing protein [Myxococcales bacterium]|nr:ATP-binding cassette domain-containing protein [Myxococcales bacterium]